MPAKSKAQQRFFGMVRATQKGEMASPSPEVAKAATSMSKSSVKKFAKTKHDKLPEKKLEEIHNQAHTPHEVPSKNLKGLVKKAVKRIDTDVDGDTDHNDKKKGELGEFVPGVGNKRLFSSTKTKTATEGFKTDILTDRRYAKRVADKTKEYKERDARMKYGKSYKKYTGDANKAKTRLRPGEVKRYDKEQGKWVSNKD